MKKAKKVFFIILIVLCGGILSGIRYLGIILTGISIDMSIDAIKYKIHPFRGYEKNWEITIPEEIAHIEYGYSDIEWLDGECYVIVKFDSRPDEFLQTFSNEISYKDMERCERAIDRLVEYGIDESKVVYPQEKFLYFSKDKNNGNDMIFLYYDVYVNTLYIVTDYT